MALITGSARQTQAQIIAELTAQVAALSAKIEDAPPVKAKAEMPAFRSKALRAKGQGHACTASDGEKCNRRDLRTAKRAQSHGIESGHIARFTK